MTRINDRLSWIGLLSVAGCVALLTVGCESNQPLEPVGAPMVYEPPAEPGNPTEPISPGSPQVSWEAEPVEVQPTTVEIQPAPAAATTYTIARGDTLWSIAQRHYGDGKQWKKIAAANPGLSPTKLRIGQSITLP